MNDAKPARPRFVAGAVCPACRALDRIVLEDQPDGQGEEAAERLAGEASAPETDDAAGLRRRRCVACGYTDHLVRDGAVEPSTRLTRRRDADAGTASTPVRIIDPGDADR